MPLPLAMMIPFMGIQSAVMAKQFGENFQFGKRRISAMSNEEFNRLTPKILMENANAELKSMIPSMEKSIKDMSSFQTFLIGEFIQMIGDMLSAGLGKVLGLDQPQVETSLQAIEHFLHGHPAGHKTTTQPVETPIITPGGSLAPPPITFPKPTPTPIKGVTQTDVSIKGLPMAGQTQIIARDNFIQSIAFFFKEAKKAPNTQLKNIWLKKMRDKQTQLKALLAKYNWR